MAEPGKRMSIGLDSALDLFGKVGRDRAAVERHVTPDAMFNFVVTAHALRDWVKQDPTISSHAKKAAEEMTESNEWLRACKDLANGNKHFVIDRYPPMVEHADAATGFGKGRYEAGPYGVGEWRIKVSWGGSTYDALDLVAGVHDTWAAFFRDHVRQHEEGPESGSASTLDERGRDSP